VYGYLQNFPSLGRLLADLRTAGVCALLVVRAMPAALRQEFTSDHLQFSDSLVDLNQVAQQADWVISHANMQTMAAFVYAGLPQLLIPRHQEQLFTAIRLVEQGCAVLAYQDQPGFAAEIQKLQTDTRYRQRAAQLQADCSGLDASRAALYVRQTFESLLPASD
jgi:UDP:flavonoid glycosyltransferase YjiC (YdhE family)